jgi:hypothetical protein
MGMFGALFKTNVEARALMSTAWLQDGAIVPLAL